MRKQNIHVGVSDFSKLRNTNLNGNKVVQAMLQKMPEEVKIKFRILIQAFNLYYECFLSKIKKAKCLS